jgi:hypothetical protein
MRRRTAGVTRETSRCQPHLWHVPQRIFNVSASRPNEQVKRPTGPKKGVFRESSTALHNDRFEGRWSYIAQARLWREVNGARSSEGFRRDPRYERRAQSPTRLD